MPDGRRLRVGLAGCGAIARLVHLPLLARRADVELVALADASSAALDESISSFAPGASRFPDLDAMLGAVELDAVVVTLPTELHAEAARAVLESDLHLFVEKPLATSGVGAGEVLELAESTDRVVVVGFNCRANPLMGRLRERIRAARAGQVVYFRTVFATAPRELPAWKSARSTGGGALLDLGAHHLDLVRFLFDCEIRSVRATLDSRRTEHDTALLDLEMENGIRGQAFFSLAAAETERVEVFGEDARLSVSRFTSLDVEIVDNPGAGGGSLGRGLRGLSALRRLPEAFAARREPLREPGYRILLDGFVRGALAGSQPPDGPDLRDGFACAAAVEAAERSAISGRPQSPVAPPARPSAVDQPLRR